MTAHDYPVRKLTIEDLEQRASDLRARCGIAPGSAIDVLEVLFAKMPEYLQKLGLTLIERKPGHMGEREAYAAPKAKRIFYRPSLLARLKFGDDSASLIFLHELAHILLHQGNGGAEKAWLKYENNKVSFVSEEESAEWQATMLALCIKAPASIANLLGSADALAQKFGLDDRHAKLRFEILRRRLPRKVPEIYRQVRNELIADSAEDIADRRKEGSFNVSRLCPDCGAGTLAELDGKLYCAACKICGAKLQDGDTFG